jgi:hypothetical protein
MKKIISILIVALTCAVGIIACQPSESAIQAAIAETQAVENSIAAETQAAVQAVTQAALELQQTEEAQIAQTQAAAPQICTPGGTYSDVEGDADVDYMDILKVDTSLEGELLTVTFYLKNLPDEITINKEDSPEGASEYFWGVGIDVDADANTGMKYSRFGSGDLGMDKQISLFNFAWGPTKTGKIEEVMTDNTYVWVTTGENSYSADIPGDFSVDYDQKTITISGQVAGITPDSLLFFSTQEGSGVVDNLCVN